MLSSNIIKAGVFCSQLLKSSQSLNSSRILLKSQQVRYINLHEYQCKKLLYDNGIAVQDFRVVDNIETLNEVLEEFKPEEYVVKAQILAGGRGKGLFKQSLLKGGVKITNRQDEVVRLAKLMLNDRLITKQTTSDGELVEKIMIADAVRLDREFYFAILLDRSYDLGPILVCSSNGGVDIEETSSKNPRAIVKYKLPLNMELDTETCSKLVMQAYSLNMFESDIINQCIEQIQKLVVLFKNLDATQIEINPLGITDKGKVICVDSKLQFDENARFRQRWLIDLDDAIIKEGKDQRDALARKHNLNFISLDGSVGCLVNGAGLAMATMDLLSLNGGKPANFLDIGGSANSRQVMEALKIITSDKNVKSIFVNIFGGIMRCDLVAEGLVDAVKTLNIECPIVARLEGSQVEAARKLIKSSSTSIIMYDDLNKAAEVAVDLASYP